MEVLLEELELDVGWTVGLVNDSVDLRLPTPFVPAVAGTMASLATVGTKARNKRCFKFPFILVTLATWVKIEATDLAELAGPMNGAGSLGHLGAIAEEHKRVGAGLLHDIIVILVISNIHELEFCGSKHALLQ
jgi:hypothetical protein